MMLRVSLHRKLHCRLMRRESSRLWITNGPVLPQCLGGVWFSLGWYFRPVVTVSTGMFWPQWGGTLDSGVAHIPKKGFSFRWFGYFCCVFGRSVFLELNKHWSQCSSRHLHGLSSWRCSGILIFSDGIYCKCSVKYLSKTAAALITPTGLCCSFGPTIV